MIGIDIYGRENCDVCKRLKKRISDLGFNYNSHEIDKYLEYHDDWRYDGSVEITAALHVFSNSHIPVIKLNGEFTTFAGVINFLREIKNGKKSA